jgi:DNA repair protein RecO (recombination protein O)
VSWSTQKTEAIVIALHPMREADRWYRALTPVFGKIEFTGRGAQKVLAKLAPHLEPFAVVDLEIVRGRRSTTVISVERKHVFSALDHQLERRILASTSGILLDLYTREGLDDPALYQFFIDWLAFLNDDTPLTSAQSTMLLAGFVLRLLSRLGYEVELDTCLSCRKDVGDRRYRWHSARGGLVCGDCESSDSQDWFAAREIRRETLEFLRFLKRASWQEILEYRGDKETVQESSLMIHDLVLHHIPTYIDTPFWKGLLASEWLDSRNKSL